jgi:uncharacterized phage protein (predicted DNA packaging)
VAGPYFPTLNLWVGFKSHLKCDFMEQRMITLQEAKTHCRIDGDDDDAELTAFIAAAGAHVENYLGVTYTDQAPAPVKAACALLVSDLYEHRESQVERPLTPNRTFCALLDPYRAMAA